MERSDNARPTVPIASHVTNPWIDRLPLPLALRKCADRVKRHTRLKLYPSLTYKAAAKSLTRLFPFVLNQEFKRKLLADRKHYNEDIYKQCWHYESRCIAM
jgi:hypothetical protein